MPAHLVEQDVLELVNLLTLKPEAMDAMLELAVQSEAGFRYLPEARRYFSVNYPDAFQLLL